MILPGQVRAAERHGVVGLLLYTDVQSGGHVVPRWAVRRGSAYLLGDPSPAAETSKSTVYILRLCRRRI